MNRKTLASWAGVSFLGRGRRKTQWGGPSDPVPGLICAATLLRIPTKTLGYACGGSSESAGNARSGAITTSTPPTPAQNPSLSNDRTTFERRRPSSQPSKSFESCRALEDPWLIWQDWLCTYKVIVSVKQQAEGAWLSTSPSGECNLRKSRAKWPPFLIQNPHIPAWTLQLKLPVSLGAGIQHSSITTRRLTAQLFSKAQARHFISLAGYAGCREDENTYMTIV